MKKKKLWVALIAIFIVAIVTTNCKKDEYEEITGECPIVVSTSPANLETGVILEKIITVTFNTKMNEATITQAAFTLNASSKKNGEADEIRVEGVLTYNATNNTMSFVPLVKLAPNTTYTGRVLTSVKEIHGNALQTPYTWTFSTGSFVPPTVISTVPRNAAVNVGTNTKVSATFSESMNPLTITASTFTLKHGSTLVNGLVTYAGNTSTFSPSGPLAANTIYTATITTGAQNTVGTALSSNYVWSFTTGSVPDETPPVVILTVPGNLSTDVMINSRLLATFSEAMDHLSITNASFTLKNGITAVPASVSYTGVVATLRPLTVLTPNTLYTATITTAAKDLAGNQMEQNYIWTFTTGAVPDIVAPTVIVTVPENLATGVAFNARPSAIFSEAMDPLTINHLTFLIKQGATPIAGVITYSGISAVFTPLSNFAANTVYSATITNEVEDLAGNKMVNNYNWSFTTGSAPDNTPPTVVAVFPTNLATNQAVTINPTATFSEMMDVLTINAATFKIKQGSTPIAGVITYAGLVATFSPGSDFAANTVYTATITNNVEDLAGNSMVNDFVWSFTTAPAPDVTTPNVISTFPVNLSTNVPLHVNPTATFSELMDPLTINASSFTLKQGANSVTGNVSYAGSTATFVPAASLAGNTLYTATVVNTVKDLAGNNMVNNYVWTFTTVSLPAPTVISTDPVNLGTGVQLNKVITADFSEMMNPLTINGASFTLKIGTTPVDGQVSYSGVKATFTPTSNLSSGTTYIATITTAAENLTGIPLENDYEWTFTTVNAAGAPFVDLKSVARFGIIAGVGISNNAGFSVINDQDVGISPGVRSSITGFPPAIVVNGAIYASDDIAPPGVGAMLAQAKLDLTEAYLFAEGATVPAPATVSGDQGGLTLYPGIYKSTSTLLIQSGDLTLDAQGDENAVWIFQVAAGFTTVGGAGGNVILSGGAQAKNVFWQTGSSATIGDNTSFKGNILALTSITMNSGAVAQGRMLCSNGAIVLTNTNIINKP